MELLTEKKDKKIYQEENTTYTVLNWGEYAYSLILSPLENIPEEWKLTSMDVYNETKEEVILHVEALYEPKPLFKEPMRPLQLTLESGQYKRMIIFKNGRKEIDYIIENISSEEKIYYLRENVFVSDSKEILPNTEIITSDIASTFFKTGEKLNAMATTGIERVKGK